MANYKIEAIEGIASVLGEQLRAAGIHDTDQLLEAGATRKGRNALAQASGISESKILKFVNMADLFRIDGVAEEYSELLEAAGVDTVPELAQRNAENLTAKMEEVNAVRKLTRRVPSLKEVTKWIEQAAKLPRVMEY
ncbi:DUF4332 domain-containing protein [uncultured Alistipes sp.]|jgi:molybdenum cofactor biosynthesis protein|uniref:DUF4332 domain-containing protein n=1 Tax=uncultured Alistipes sp. TaxID=538949 RepID=UPI0025EAF1D9|nr:DUF4332 domain-containing protein [uncultured Alistipes sp.]